MDWGVYTLGAFFFFAGMNAVAVRSRGLTMV